MTPDVETGPRQPFATRDGRIRFIVSVDTEEDNWEPARDGITVENIRALPRFHALMQRLGLRPTYLATYQVARVPWAVTILKGLTEAGAGEIGAHLHPWNTPPLDEPLTAFNSMMNNLPGTLQRRKLAELTEGHRRAFGAGPVSFRAGRYGLDGDLLAPLLDLGYRVDSSVTPYFSWQDYDGGPSHMDAPMDVYRLAPGSRLDQPDSGGRLREVPLSCGYNRLPFEFWHPFYSYLRRPVMRRLHAPGIAWRARLVRRILLSPEFHDVADMLALSRRLMARGVSFLNLTLHSSSLVPGLSPFAPTAADVDRVLARLEGFVSRLAATVTLQPVTLADFATPEISAKRTGT